MKIMQQAALTGLCLLAAVPVQAGPLTGQAANWHMDEEQGQQVADLSGNKRHGTLGPTAATETQDPTWTLRRFDNAALAFDGQEDYVKVAHSPVLQPVRLSVEAWVKAGEMPVDYPRYVVAKGADGCHRAAYAIYTSGNGGLSFYVSVGDSYVESPVADAGLWDGAWHHVVGTYDRVAVRLYVDGVEVGEGVASKLPIAYPAFTFKNLYIGDYDGDSAVCENLANFPGAIDDVRIWNRALTAAEVAERAAGY